MKTQRAVSVSRGADRFGDDLRIWGLIPLQVKVSTADTAGALFLFEHRDMGPGGPPRMCPVPPGHRGRPAAASRPLL